MFIAIILLVVAALLVLGLMLYKGSRRPLYKNSLVRVRKVKPLKKKGTLVRLFAYVKGKAKYFIIALCGMVIVVTLNLLQPLIIAEIYSLLAEVTFNSKKFTLLMIAIVGIMLLNAVISYSQAISLQKAGQKIIYELREQVFTKIESLSIEQLNLTPVGKLVTRVTSDTGAISEMYTRIIINLISNVLTLVGVVVAMFLVNATLALYVLMVAPIIAILSFIFRKYSIGYGSNGIYM